MSVRQGKPQVEADADLLARVFRGRAVLDMSFRKDTTLDGIGSFLAGDRVPLDVDDRTLAKWLANRRVVCVEGSGEAVLKAEAEAKAKAEPVSLDAIQARLAAREKHPLDADAFAALVEAVRSGAKGVAKQYHVSFKDVKAIRDALEQG